MKKKKIIKLKQIVRFIQYKQKDMCVYDGVFNENDMYIKYTYIHINKYILIIISNLQKYLTNYKFFIYIHA